MWTEVGLEQSPKRGLRSDGIGARMRQKQGARMRQKQGGRMKQKQGVRVGENKPPSDLGAKSLCIGHSERGGEDILRAVYRTYRVRPSVLTEFA